MEGNTITVVIKHKEDGITRAINKLRLFNTVLFTVVVLSKLIKVEVTHRKTNEE